MFTSNAHAIGPSAVSPITHIVVVVQENHSFDNYFGTYPTANGTLVNSITKNLEHVNGLPNRICLPFKSRCVPPRPAKGYTTTDPNEGQLAYENDYDGGRMDGFPQFSGPQSMTYFDYHQISAYWVYAEEYGLADNYFASAMTTGGPNRLILFAGDTPVPDDDAPPSYISYSNTVLAQLSDNGISWGYYDYGIMPYIYPFIYFSNFTRSAASNIHDVSAFFQELSNGTLPAVNFVMALGANGLDEQPPSNVTLGETWTVSVVNAIMASSYWNSTVILITWGDGSGYYDHVPPPQLLTIDHNFTHALHGYGERVPLLVISPYAKENYVSHQVLNHMSITRFIEDNWQLPTLNRNVAESNSLEGFLDLKMAPRAPIILGATGAYNVSSFPAPIQIPFDTLPYSRSSTANNTQLITKPFSIADAFAAATAKVKQARLAETGSTSRSKFL